MKHPPLPQLADHARAVAKLLDTQPAHNPTNANNSLCRCIECRARLLGTGARGYPHGTLGDGTGARSSDSTSSTERAAGIVHQLSSWANIDTELTKALQTWWHTGLIVQTIIDRITTHAPDDDPLPAGTGPCTIRTCETVCRPDNRRPDNRLRAGLCPACWTSWQKHQARNQTSSLVEWRPIRTAALRPKPVAS